MKVTLLKSGRRAILTIFLLLVGAIIQVNAQVVINEIYGGGGNAGATYQNDYVELFNNGATDVSLTGYSIQYASSTGTTWAVTSLTGTIYAGQPYLVRLASSGAVGAVLPAANATGTTNISAANGKIALVNNTTALTGACPTTGGIVDFVGFGTANCAEVGGTPTSSGATAPAGSNTASIGRTGGVDSGANASDFTAQAPTPTAYFGPTAAGTSAGGRVTEANGRGIFRALVTMTDSQGNQRFAYTNQLGYYQFENVPGGQVYVFSAFHRRYMFDQPTQVQFVGEEQDGINFIGTSGGFFRFDPWNLPTKGIQ